jgi:hypothetical protein
MNWQDPVDFAAGNHGNKPFSIRIPSLVVTRGKSDRLNFLTAMWFTPTGAEPSRMVVAIQKKTLTYDYLLERGEFVMSAPTDKMMDVVVFAGYISGHDVDKWQAANLTAIHPSKISVPLIGEAIGNVEYKVVSQIRSMTAWICSSAKFSPPTFARGSWKANFTARTPTRCSTWAPSMTAKANPPASTTPSSRALAKPITNHRF